MPTMLALRKRMPPVVFLLLLILVAMVVGLACACLAGQPMQAADRSLGGAPALPPPLIELWALLTAVLLPVAVMVVRRPATTGRASPAVLQRFLL